MKKGHRRTQSATICLNRPLEKEHHSKPIHCQEKFKHFPETHAQPINIFDIQTLLKNSQAKIHERVFLIDNLQRPITNVDSCAHFQFGKGSNLKLKPQNNIYALNMLQIPQEAKSKQSPSIHNEDKFSIQDKDTFFTQKPFTQQKYSKIDKINSLRNYGIKTHNNKGINSVQANMNQKITKPKHAYTKSTKILSYKNPTNSVLEKQAVRTHVHNHQHANNQININNKKIIVGVREEYQTHKKNALSYNFKPTSMLKQKQSSMEVFGLLKRKKKSFVI